MLENLCIFIEHMRPTLAHCVIVNTQVTQAATVTELNTMF